MSDLKMPARTPLMEMHKRYEETMAEYTRLELAENAARAEDTDYNETPYRTAMKSSCRESEALRTAILHQAPANAWEAAVLQFHISNGFDLMVGSSEDADAEKEALQRGIETLLDFMCCQVRQDQEQIGAAFRDEAARVHVQRRYRAGQVED